MKEKRLWIDVIADTPTIPEYDDFTKHGIFVGNLFTFYLPLVVTSKMSKIVIEFSPQPDALYLSSFGSIHTIKETFPFSKFRKQDFSGKVKLLSEHAHRCLTVLYKRFDLDLAQLHFGYQQILSNNFKLSRELFKGPRYNKTKTIKAIAVADFSLDYTQVKINFLDKNDTLLSESLLFKTLPGWFGYTRLLKSARWIDHETF